MKNDEVPQEERHSEQTEIGFREKKTYRKPSFRHEKVFEIRALICGKVGSSSQACHQNPRNS